MRRKHGHTYANGVKKASPEYNTWLTMRNRCNYPNQPGYARYGGRGIKVCARWMVSFEDFLADVGLKPGPKHTLDRVDNDGNYEPSNCRWATPKEQNAQRIGKKLSAETRAKMTAAQVVRWAMRKAAMDIAVVECRN